MNFEQSQFCLDTVKKGDSLLICLGAKEILSKPKYRVNN